MTEIGNKMFINLHGDTKEEFLKSIKEERKKICKALRQANDDRDERKAVNFIIALEQLETIAKHEGEKEDDDSFINEKRKKLCKSLVQAFKRKDRKANDYLHSLAKLELYAEFIEMNDNEEESIKRFITKLEQ